jgi:hypothetical protein
MRSGKLPTGESQLFYFPEDHPSMPGWFKGMEQIIRERGLWPEAGLPAQCPEFKCPPDRVDCCCRRVLFVQPDFTAQRSQLQEQIELRGHLCDFYPKYHCELNFIEQYWGAAKARYRVVPRAKTVQEMENTVKESLDSVPLLQIRRSVLFLSFCHASKLIPSHRFANRAARFVSAYKEGLSGAQAAWANRKYHGHRTLPPQGILAAKGTIDI